MITKWDVFEELKEMNSCTDNSCRGVLFTDIANTISLSERTLLALLVQLEVLDLIRIYKTTVMYISFTNHGLQHERGHALLAHSY